MTRLRIDNREVDVPAGATVLDAAGALGIAIPTLCYLAGRRPCTSCFVCLVKVAGREAFAPACATPAEEGMVVQSDADEVRQARRTALELLLSDHLGDCQAPCQVTCPARMDVPRMIRQIAAGDLPGAIATVKADIALPAVLGRICPAPCERSCRRSVKDHAVSICLLKRYAADADLSSPRPYRPELRPPSGRRVAVVGAGPTGLSAAYYLLQSGHACTVFDAHAEPGGALRYAVGEDRLPRQVLSAEVAAVAGLGAAFELNRRIDAPLLADLRRRFDAVVVAVGKAAAPGGPAAGELGLPTGQHGILVDHHTHVTSEAGVFAGGEAVRPGRLAVRAVADGKAIACSVDQYLAGHAVAGPRRPFTVHVGRLREGEIDRFMVGASPSDRLSPAQPLDGFSADEARAEARRCLHCDCRRAEDCRLRIHADAYAVQLGRFKTERRLFEQLADHVAGDASGGATAAAALASAAAPGVGQAAGGELRVIYEPGKCIACGLCVQITQEAGEEPGLAFVGRGFNVRVSVPFGRPIGQALRKTARACAEACPAGALVVEPASDSTPSVAP